jgi:hypothetical protein
VMVMARLAADVRVLAGGQVDALDEPELPEQLEGSEDGGPADPGVVRPGIGNEVGGREMSRASGDQVGDQAPGGGGAIAVATSGGRTGGLEHSEMILSLNNERKPAFSPGWYGHRPGPSSCCSRGRWTRTLT